jgi:hypothetical protein
VTRSTTHFRLGPRHINIKTKSVHCQASVSPPTRGVRNHDHLARPFPTHGKFASEGTFIGLPDLSRYHLIDCKTNGAMKGFVVAQPTKSDLPFGVAKESGDDCSRRTAVKAATPSGGMNARSLKVFPQGPRRRCTSFIHRPSTLMVGDRSLIVHRLR